ncbi:two-component system sensor histidine kinase PhcS [Prosthecobacter fusiformis]|uniref:histidine kinase n=1 Tax=Prosthecobacter fusiformis TaxID=48464 RepID=A0A4R7RP30_9BACT|nr:ATP-binding protein [Prosthecobacter fusiformis]TDU66505.1 two-component system sensor histidine kinase PhcS [Prosthecobacter fusiformis]
MIALTGSPPNTAPLHFPAASKERPVIPQTAPPVDPSILAAAEKSARFEGELQELNMRNARLGAWFVMVLVPFCAVLDWLAYPAHFWEFLLLRILCSSMCIPLLLALDRPWAARYHRVYPVILPLLPAMAICLMIYFSGDGSSSYYAGLMLCLVGTSFVFHWTFREIGLTVALVLAFYLAATIPNLNFNGDPRSIGLFINNTLFILLTCVILYCGSRQHHAIRLREFVNRCKVEAQREELARRNQELSATLKRLKETEAQLNQSEKLASIGRLSAGIVHEINNPLNFVKSALFVLKKKTKNMPPESVESVAQILADIGEGVDRVASIVSDLRTFAHPENKGSSPVSLHLALAKAARLMAQQVGDSQAKLHLEVPEHLTALGDENHIIQILINLIQNSLDAMQHHPSPEIFVRGARDGDEILLSVRDNGPGIPEESLQRIFDPFFTTKEVGQGMGLGLSLCYRMMQGMGGSITPFSQLGTFTEFTLRFKPSAAPAPAAV